MEKIINLTLQHSLTDSQRDAGLYNPVLSEDEMNSLKRLMMVDPESTEDEIVNQSKELLSLINKICGREKVYSVHIMGQFELVHYLINGSNWDPIINIKYFVSTTKRISKEVVQADGSVVKTNVFEFVRLRRIKAVFE